MTDGLAGIETLMRGVLNYSSNARKGLEKGTLLALKNVLTTSNAQVPHETGALQRDGGVGLTEQGDTVRGAVSYGRRGDTPKYAVRQHEDMSLHHDSGRNAKFLENAFNATKDQNAEIIAQAIKKETGL